MLELEVLGFWVADKMCKIIMWDFDELEVSTDARVIPEL